MRPKPSGADVALSGVPGFSNGFGLEGRGPKRSAILGARLRDNVVCCGGEFGSVNGGRSIDGKLIWIGDLGEDISSMIGEGFGFGTNFGEGVARNERASSSLADVGLFSGVGSLEYCTTFSSEGRSLSRGVEVGGRLGSLIRSSKGQALSVLCISA